MIKENSLADRVNAVLTFKKMSVNMFSRRTGLLQGTINPQINGSRPIMLPVVMGILDVFPDVSAEWLMRGKGEMIATEETRDAEEESPCNDVPTQWRGWHEDCDRLLAEKDARIEELQKDKEFLTKLVENYYMKK